jgi:holo-[acyl-carrier protein] synthase
VIAGVGVDLVAIEGLRAQLADPASAFAEGTFTARERADAAARPSGDPARHLAARFAAKEAFLKAWAGGRFGHAPALRHADLRQIEVSTDAWGRPRLRLAPDLARALDADGPWRAHLSLSHDGAYATAYVVLERGVAEETAE